MAHVTYVHPTEPVEHKLDAYARNTRMSIESHEADAARELRRIVNEVQRLQNDLAAGMRVDPVHLEGMTRDAAAAFRSRQRDYDTMVMLVNLGAVDIQTSEPGRL